VSIFAAKVVWNAAVRFFLFWLLVAGALYVLAQVTPYSGWERLSNAFNQDQEELLKLATTKDFAFALASAIVQFGGALAFAFLVAHVVLF
jgi:hypothetical protein